jgi:hypothetical protein
MQRPRSVALVRMSGPDRLYAPTRPARAFYARCEPRGVLLPIAMPCHAMPCPALRLGEVGLIGDVAAFASWVCWAGRRHPAALGLDSAGQFVVADPGHVVV